MEANLGNVSLVAGARFDTGLKYIDANGVVSPILRKVLALNSLPNNSSKNFAHAETLSVTKYARASFWASNGTIHKSENSVGCSTEVTATNVAIATTTDLSLYVNGLIVLDFCL